jgi:dTDP-glucose 4,6-dehydratase
VNWRGKKVLVTGAGGFIGSHLTERLAELGADVRALVRYNSWGTRGWLETSQYRTQIRFVAGDVRDPALVRAAVHDVDVVFHLAALIAIPYSYQAPISYVQTNIEGTLNLLQAVRDAKVQYLIHTSTSEVYGTARTVPIGEAHPLQAQSPYAASKIGADKLVESFHLSFGLPVVTIRPFNTFGPRQSARAVIPTIISQCLARGVVRLGNLHPTRDLNFVADTVDGFLTAARPEAVGRTINLGSGREISIGDLARLIAKLTGREVTLQCDEQRSRPEKSEVERLLADNTLARTVLGWTPRYTLEEGLTRTIDWVRTHLDRYTPDAYAV